MAIRRILNIEDPEDRKILKAKARPVQLPNPKLKALIADMFETMHAANGVGLAAPQIGISQRLAVIYIPPEVEEREDGTQVEVAPAEEYALINPQIIKRSEQEETDHEGCLSMPGWYGEVPRPAWVTVEFSGLDGKRYRLRKADGLLGRALQHEIDHLDGVMFTERMRDLSTLKDYSKDKADAPSHRPQEAEPTEA